MVPSKWPYVVIPLWVKSGLLVSAYSECLVGFALQGLEPFGSTDWVGSPVCDGSIAAADVDASWCSPSFSYSCFWSSVVGCTTDTDDGSCTCQACGGFYDDADEYMLELPIWDRARCVIYAMEEGGYDVTPCVEAVVDAMSLPGVIEEWTPPAVDRIACITIDSYKTSDDPPCAYQGTPRFATEVFDDNAAGLASTDECLIGFALQGLEPFGSTDWVGSPVCDGSIAAADVDASWCTTSFSYSCFWSVVGCTTDTDDGSCTCQACGGFYDDADEYMLELPIWDRARCVIYAMEEGGFDVTPCVEAVVDAMSLPGVIEEWTSPAVDRTACIAIDSYKTSDDTPCAYPGTPRFATEVFDDSTSSGPTTPAPVAEVAPVTTSPAAAASISPAPISLSEAPAPGDGGAPTPTPQMMTEISAAPAEGVIITPASPSSTEPISSDGEGAAGLDDANGVSPAPAGFSPAPAATRSTTTTAPDAADVIVATAGGGGDGLADWAGVVIGLSGLLVAGFAAWTGYKTYRHHRPPQQDV